MVIFYKCSTFFKFAWIMSLNKVLCCVNRLVLNFIYRLKYHVKGTTPYFYIPKNPNISSWCRHCTMVAQKYFLVTECFSQSWKWPRFNGENLHKMSCIYEICIGFGVYSINKRWKSSTYAPPPPALNIPLGIKPNVTCKIIDQSHLFDQ